MTRFSALSDSLGFMRIPFLTLILAALPAGLAGADTAPSLTVATNRDLYLEGVPNRVYLEARVSVPPEDAATPPAPLNIAYVLDRSGGLAGEPIQSLRRAMSVALNTLGASDTVSLVLFGSQVDTLVESRHRDQLGDLDQLLAHIEPAGGSALYDALNQGAAQLRRSAGPGVISHLVLVTAGKPTKGPTEPGDFAKLAALFNREGITLSTIGVGPDFNEDLLAGLARAGGGRFRFASQPARLAEALQAETTLQRSIAARDAVLTFEFNHDCTEVKSYGWAPTTVVGTTVAVTLSQLPAGHEISVLASAQTPDGSIRCNVATVRLRWLDNVEGKPRETAVPVTVILDRSSDMVHRSINPAVIHATVTAVISDAMQKAIEQIDRGEFRRAERTLRSARADALSLNADAADPVAEARIRQLDAYLAEVQARGLSQLDRKILRSGLYNQFEPPTSDPHADDR
ncbi:MAG TPA: VWA domain-containing protein [Candidatus Didemnitutus sp.]|nr:VWA domain-containing protein [Candidatus Didemnitutus sp.]